MPNPGDALTPAGSARNRAEPERPQGASARVREFGIKSQLSRIQEFGMNIPAGMYRAEAHALLHPHKSRAKLSKKTARESRVRH